MPRGLVSTQPLCEAVREVAGDGWAPHPGLRIAACDYASARRVLFGNPAAPAVALADAVAASCAIPGFYQPVRVDGRLYVDGGLHSTSNLDVLAGAGLDLVVCLHPTSSLHARSRPTVADRVARTLRDGAGRRLLREAERVRAAGTDVVLLQPSVLDLDSMGTNLMQRGRRHQVVESAVQSVTEHLRESGVGARLAALPAGIPQFVRRPPRPPRDWPAFEDLARARSAAPRPRARRRARPA